MRKFLQLQHSGLRVLCFACLNFPPNIGHSPCMLALWFYKLLWDEKIRTKFPFSHNVKHFPMSLTQQKNVWIKIPSFKLHGNIFTPSTYVEISIQHSQAEIVMKEAFTTKAENNNEIRRDGNQLIGITAWCWNKFILANPPNMLVNMKFDIFYLTLNRNHS